MIVGCIMTSVIAFFIIVACAGAIWAVRPRDIQDAAEAALGLKPFGQYAFLLFSAGLFNASIFAACILPLSTAYSVCEGLGFEAGVNKRMREAPVFYLLYTLLIVVGAGVVLIPGFPLVQDDSALAGAERRAAAVRADLHDPADQQAGPDGRVGQPALVQPGLLGHGGDHDRADAGAGGDHGEGDDVARPCHLVFSCPG